MHAASSSLLLSSLGIPCICLLILLHLGVSSLVMHIRRLAPPSCLILAIIESQFFLPLLSSFSQLDEDMSSFRISSPSSIYIP
jgi:hypothetical protein